MPEMSLSEAASWAGKGRPAILKAFQKGTIGNRFPGCFPFHAGHSRGNGFQGSGDGPVA